MTRTYRGSKGGRDRAQEVGREKTRKVLHLRRREAEVDQKINDAQVSVRVHLL